MKRGKEDEKKNDEPMFPRLHVSDADKGGPRAPPRNKMALYEQLSIPSQRFNSGAAIKSNSATNSGHLHSPIQVNGHERSMFSPPRLPPSTNPVEKTSSRYSDVNSQSVQQQQKEKQDEDDFTVPIFVQSGVTHDRPRNQHKRGNGNNSSTPAHVSTSYTSHSVKHQSASERDPKRTDSVDLNVRQERVTHREENSRELVAGLDQSVKTASKQSFTKGSIEPLKQTTTFASFGLKNHVSKSNQFQSNGCGVESRRDSTVWGDSISNEGIRVIEAHPEMLGSPYDHVNGDAVSETSMVDSISGIDISPDDVVGIIGQKHFWKARRAIVNQQRLFAVQVFELHRLIKVQKLIAGSPQLLVEENAFIGKPTKVTPTKNLPLEYIVKPASNISKSKDDCEKLSQNVEFSAENAFNKTSISSVQNVNQPSGYKPFPGNPQQTTDPKMGPWGFNQPPEHQWLIPVMTPSEGLVYKPYPGPGFMSPAFGGCVPPGATPMMGHNYVNYGVPPPPHHHYQGLGIPPFAPPPSHGYFPPYGMSSMNTSASSSAGEQMHNFNMDHRNSSNIASETRYEKNGAAVPNVGKFREFKESEVQVSTASTPSDRTQQRNPLSLFPTSPVVQLYDEVADQPREIVDPTSRVIKVVPHNARLTTASVARIFQSIQEERKQYDFV